MKILRDRGPAFIFLLFVLCFGAEWDRWNDAPTESSSASVIQQSSQFANHEHAFVMPPFAAPAIQH